MRYCAAVNVLRTYRALLANGPLTRLLAGEFISAIGDWLYLVALLILVYERPGASPVLLGVVGAARVLPYVFLSVPAGIVADRYDRRLVLLGTDIIRGSIMLVMAYLVAVDGPLLALVALATLATCFSAFFGPTIGAYLPRLVRDESELGPANSAWASLDSLAFAIGPALGGVIIAVTGGLTLAFLLNAASFAVVAFVLWRLPLGPRSGAPARPRRRCRPRRRLPLSRGSRRYRVPLGRRGSPVVSIVRPITGLMVIAAVGDFVFGGLGVLTVVIATDILHEGATGTGVLNAAIGIGGLAGAVSAGVLRPAPAPDRAPHGRRGSDGHRGRGARVDLEPAARRPGPGGGLPWQRRRRHHRAHPAATTRAGLIARQGHRRDRNGGRRCLRCRVARAARRGRPARPAPVARRMRRRLPGSRGGRRGDPGPRRRAFQRRSRPAAARFVALPIFAGLSPARLEAAAMRLRPEHLPAGTVIIRQGDEADRLYFIVAGTCDVSQAPGRGRAPRSTCARWGPMSCSARSGS